MEAEPPRRVRLGGTGGLGGVGLEAGEEVDLLAGLALLRQLAQGLDGARLDAAEAVELEDMAQDVDEVLLDHAAGREPLGEAGEGGQGLLCP